MYQAVVIYDLDGTFLGYGIRSANKLQSVNIWTEAEQDQLAKRLQELNSGNDIKKAWPHPQDPEVQALLSDPAFHPIEYATAEVIDKEKSHLVYEQIPRLDINGNHTGEFEDGDIVDDQSVIRYKSIQVPKNPSDMKLRLQDAMETIARKRTAGFANAA